MICANCKREIPDGVRFCTHCGTPVAEKNSEGQESPEKSEAERASDNCSLDQTMPVKPVVPSARKTSPRTSRDASGGEKRLLVVTSVMTTLAVVAALALAVVVFDPFGANDVQDVPTTQEADAQASTDQVDAESDVVADDGVDSGATTDTPSLAAPDESEEVEPETIDSAEDDGGDSNSDYVLPDSSTYLYTAQELSDMSDWELYIARNEIFARHGRMFQKDDLQSYFEGQEWYEPLYTPEEFDSRIDSLLNETERANASTILAVEQERGSTYI